MKRFVKICLWVALPLILIGGIVCALCVGIMDKNGWDNYITRDRWGNHVLGFTSEDLLRIVTLGAVDIDADSDIFSPEWTKDFDAAEIKNLSISLGAAGLVIEEGESFEVLVNKNASGIVKVSQRDNTLIIEETSGHYWWNRTKNAQVTITLPPGTAFENVILESGAGELKIPGLSVKNLEVDVGAGLVELGRLDLKSSVDIECGAGKLFLSLIGEEEDFNFEISAGVGSVSVGSKDYSGLGFETTIDHGAEKTARISCGAGNAEIAFINE